MTALAIAVGRRETFLSRTAEPATALEIRQLIRHVRGRFLDARGWKAGRDHQRRLALGREVASAGYDGILFSPVERSEERRVGKECVSTCRSRRWPYH